MVFHQKLSLRELFEAVELPQMEEPEVREKPERRGRPRYPDKPLLNALILIPFGVASENELARKLGELPSLAEDCGFEKGKTPSQPTINRFKHKLGVEGFRKVFKGLVEKLVGGGVIDGSAEVVDATPMEAFRSDSDAEWGFKAKNNPFFGYKISVISDFKAELPVEVMISPANQHENSAFKPLVKAAKRRGLKASRICGDAIHDNDATRRFVEALGARAFIDQNPRRRRGKKPASKTYRRLKASVERVFSRAKKLLNLENLRVRGLKSTAIHVYTVFTAMLALAAAAHGKGLTKQIRCIRSIFGKT
jgi:hypothetical protein